jgi:DNA mismatch repair ATPase MutS
MEDRWIGVGDPGARYLTADHLFADDLDLFGRGSLFQFLCAARTSVGKDTLANWLLHSGSLAGISERQAAVQELSERLDVRERLAVLELDHSAFRPTALSERGDAADPLPRSLRRLARLGVAAVAILSWSFGLGYWLVAVVLLSESGLYLLQRKRLQAIAAPAGEALQAQAALAVLQKALRPVSFDSQRLQQIRATIDAQTTGSNLLDTCFGFVVQRPLLLLLAEQVTSHVDRWRQAVAAQTRQGLTAWGELEALASLAQYRFEQPDTSFPEVVSAPLLYEAEQIGHPLIPASRRVANDVMLNDNRRLLLISGSNMSGKSTLLRTVGINAVLALCGGPVCATRLRLTTFSIGTAMRFRDSLEQQTSHFYAVIERLRRITDLPTDERPLLFLIDEILQGTNSKDRVAGAEAVVRTLINRGGLGLVTTHDLELTRIVDSYGERAANVHFVDQLTDGKLSFDYLMRPGVVQTSNAIDLMRQMGLNV